MTTQTRTYLYCCIHLNSQEALKAFLTTGELTDAQPYFYESITKLNEKDVVLIENQNGLVPAYIHQDPKLEPKSQEALKSKYNITRWRQIVGVIDTTIASKLLNT